MILLENILKELKLKNKNINTSKNISKYIIINNEMDSPHSKMVIESPRYGKYIITKILTIDMIGACDDGLLEEIHNFYLNLRNKLGMLKVEHINSKFYHHANQTLYKSDIYTPISGDNNNWVDPEGTLKKFPLSKTKEENFKIIK